MSGFHTAGCPVQPLLLVGQPKVEPWLPDKTTTALVTCLFISDVGQPKFLVGNLKKILQNECETLRPQYLVSFLGGGH